MSIRPILFIILAAIAGAIAGPLAYFALDNIGRPHYEKDELFDASDLVEAYDKANVPMRIMTVVAPDTTESNCGYDLIELLGQEPANPRYVLAPGKSTAWTPWSGYNDLISIKKERRLDLARFERGRVLVSRHSLWTIRTLTDCISKTALSPLCVIYIRNKLRPFRYDNAGIYPQRIDLRREDQTICAYLDGIAAHAGKSLPER